MIENAVHCSVCRYWLPVLFESTLNETFVKSNLEQRQCPICGTMLRLQQTPENNAYVA